MNQFKLLVFHRLPLYIEQINNKKLKRGNILNSNFLSILNLINRNPHDLFSLNILRAY